jgi:hypothetical protein
MEAGPAETRAQKAARIRPELFRLLLEFDPPEEERTAAEVLLVQAKAALQRQLEAEQAAAAAAAARIRIEEAGEAQRAHDRRPLSSGFRGTCRITRDGGGLPEAEEGESGQRAPHLVRTLFFRERAAQRAQPGPALRQPTRRSAQGKRAPEVRGWSRAEVQQQHRSRVWWEWAGSCPNPRRSTLCLAIPQQVLRWG